MYLIKKVSEENEKVNGKVTTKSATTSQNNVNNNYENLQSQNNNEFEVNPSDYEIKSEDYVVMETQEQSQSNGTQNAETQTDNNQIADGSENVNKIVEKGVEDNKRFATTLMLAISIGYLVVEWILSLLSGF